jgi:hypothetical protein
MLKTSTAKAPGTAALRVCGASAVALGMLLAAKAAVAEEPRCTTHDEITRQLEQRYAEVPVSLGLSSAGKLVQVFSTEDGATWTLVLTQPDGTSCVVGAGRYWQTATPRNLGPEA